MFVIAKYHEVLRQLGFDSVEGAKNFKGELIKNHKGRRDIQRIIATSSGQTLVLFLKRNWKPYKKDGLKSLCTRGEVWSQSRTEWENSLALQRAGLTVAEPVAFGDECGLLWENFSFIITAAAPGEMTLDQFLRTCRDTGERRRVFHSLAQEIWKMHDAGLASPDLFTRHIFIEWSAGLRPGVFGNVDPGRVGDRRSKEVHGEGGPYSPKFCLIDMARLDRRRKLSPRLRARDLAALNVTAPLRFVSARERLSFLKTYGGDNTLLRLVERRSEHLLQRRKFADFAAQ